MELDKGVPQLFQANMKHGLIIGKFMPVHNGHLAMIDFAASQCDELIVSMSYTPADPIDPLIRFGWMQYLLNNRPHLRLAKVLDDFDDATLPLKERTKIWAKIIVKKFPGVNMLFSSEEYGEPLTRHLGIRHVEFDRKRCKFPVSGTLIRANPVQYQDFLPDIVKAYFNLES
jgi:HTH-type transcriptional regulator, transcriptional repressor of NAD biosynthesis genes